MYLVLLTAIHGRHALARAWLAHHAAERTRLAAAGHRLDLVVMLSPDDVRPLFEDLEATGALWSAHENHPVAYKWQAALSFARRKCPGLDAIQILGSDDFASAGWLDRTFGELAAGRRGFGLDETFELDSFTGLLGRWRGPMMLSGRPIPAGCGRTFSAALLERVQWLLWTEPRDSSLDTCSSRRLIRRGIWMDVLPMDDGAGQVIVGVKTAENIHKWADLPMRHIIDPAPAGRMLDAWGLAALAAFMPAGKEAAA